MSKLTGFTGLSRRSSAKETQERSKSQEKITTVSTRRNITTGTPPMPLRLTENDRANLNLWLEALEEGSGKNITAAKLFRGLINMKDKINTKVLIRSINDVT
ncbi:hypothetical protein [Shewanella psychromarinicola]|uniref:Uncharacterized protein n=1 Tax=Shewanella psychromarinicola TaxID=2487742 RepID=A0A3N4DLI9_9GAMM|nr:hypothetical protein [Shewanella psychromarinicola]MCL1084339.1 hypothetical protein [Shewanella psychromarinicola]RPA22460.1 hypothetical protein EGC77_22040 [Shewanella psychromarinicola]